MGRPHTQQDDLLTPHRCKSFESDEVNRQIDILRLQLSSAKQVSYSIWPADQDESAECGFLLTSQAFWANPVRRCQPQHGACSAVVQDAGYVEQASSKPWQPLYTGCTCRGKQFLEQQKAISGSGLLASEVTARP